MVLEFLQIQSKLAQAFAFQPVRHESGIFRFECIKACLRHDLSGHVESQPRSQGLSSYRPLRGKMRDPGNEVGGISATHNIKPRLAIKFPTPYEW